jgi:hypothetical protein
MKSDKSKQPVDYLLIIGGVMVVQSSMMKASGPLTSAVKIFESLGGAGCCLASLVKSYKKSQQDNDIKKK